MVAILLQLTTKMLIPKFLFSLTILENIFCIKTIVNWYPPHKGGIYTGEIIKDNVCISGCSKNMHGEGSFKIDEFDSLS